MAFGLLQSIIPEVDKNTTLYGAPNQTLAQGKISISSKNYNPVRVRVCLSTTSAYDDVEYLEYDRYINYGETYETGIISVGNGQRIVVRADHTKVNFVFTGEEINEGSGILNGNYSGLLGNVISTNSDDKLLYSVPTGLKANTATLNIVNLKSFPAKARIGLLKSVDAITDFSSEDYIEYDVEIGPNDTYVRSDLKLDESQKIVVSSSNDSKLQFLVHGRLRSALSGGQDDFDVDGRLYVSGPAGIGTVPRVKLDVIGGALISGQAKVGLGMTIGNELFVGQNLSVGGTISGTFDPTDVSNAIFTQGSLPAVDGSALTGVTAQGTGVAIQDDTVPQGTATTLNFNGGIAAVTNGSTATVSLANQVNVLQTLTVNSNKFIVEGATGNTTVAGNVNVQSNLTVSGHIDVLNSHIVNVGYPTSDHHAVSRSYVDSKTTAMSIALS